MQSDLYGILENPSVETRTMAKKEQSQTLQSAPEAEIMPAPAADERKDAQPAGSAPDGSAVASNTSAQSILFNNDAHKAAQLITLAALYSPISQLSLSPV